MAAQESQGLDGQLRAAKRNVSILTVAQSILGSAAPLSFSVGGLAGFQLLGADKSLATAPLTGFNVGVALGAIVVAAASRFLGRRESFMVGALMGAIGGAVAALALFRSEFWLFAFGLLLIGLSGGFTQKIRFAAADASPSFYKGKAISWILAGGIVSAIVGPQLAIWLKDWMEPVTFAGAFMGLVPLMLLAIVVLSLLTFAGSLYLVRSQATVGEVAWMKAMIPHHSIAILTSERAKLRDPRVRELAAGIIETQREEISRMKQLIAYLEAPGPR